MGRIEFPHEFIITGDLLGKEYLTQIGNVSVVVQMPIADESKGGLSVDLKSPYKWFEFDASWDMWLTLFRKIALLKRHYLCFEEMKKTLRMCTPHFLIGCIDL